MQITTKELKSLISEMVKARLNEGLLTEGAKEIPIRMVMDDIKDVVVSSIADELTRELKMDEGQIVPVLSRAFDKMVREIVLELDKPGSEPPLGAPRRRIFTPGV